MNINYIKDKEINLDKNDLLGAKPYVDALHKIIETSDTPFTIGLFGGWGVGKSSIIRTIQEKFKEDKKSDTTVFIYDAWKYANDSFRRTFLYELKEHFKLDVKDKFKYFYEDINEDVEHKLAINKYSLLWWLMFSPLVLLFIWALPTQTDLKITTSIISIILTLITTLLKETFVRYKVTVSKPRFFAPEQFEEVFNEIIASITGQNSLTWNWLNKLVGKKKKEVRKIVIVIDNIDRCHKDLAFELLLTVKNFLEKKNVLFIIPIDEVEIRKHINTRGNDPNEFLRKLFNTTIYIKKISEGDLFDFAKTLNENYTLNLPVEVISIISQEFSKNPRKIIQFLNVLQTELVLAEFQEESGLIPTGSITGNHPFFTKLLIIREEWPYIFSKLKDSPILINSLHIEPNSELYGGFELTKEQLRFFKRTEHIVPNHSNLELFFNNKDSFKDIPDLTNKLVESNDFEGIKNQLDNNELSSEKLIEFIDHKFELAVQRGEIKTTIVNILSLIFQLSNNSIINEEINKQLYGKGKFFGNIKNFINSSSVDPIILDLNSNLLITFIKNNPQLTRSLKTRVVVTINENKRVKKLLIEYLNAFRKNPNEYKLIVPKFTQLIKDDSKFLSEVEDILSDPKAVENLINNSLTDSIIGEVAADIDAKENLSRIVIISIVVRTIGLSDEQFELYFEKIIGFINATNDYQALPFWIKEMSFLLKFTNIDDRIITVAHNTIQTKQDWFWNTYRTSWNKSEYLEALFKVLNSIKELYYITNDSNQSQIQISWLINFFSRNESLELIRHINNLFKEIIEKFQVYNWPFSQNIVDRFIQINDLPTKIEIASSLNLMLSKTSADKGLTKTQIITSLRSYTALLNGENREMIIRWFSIFVQNPNLAEPIRTVVSELAGDEKINTIRVIRLLGDNDLMEVVLYEIFVELECEKLEEVLNQLIQAEIPMDAIKKGIKKTIRELERDDVNYNCLIEFFSRSNLSDGVIQNLLAEKIKPLLVSDSKDDILFALEVTDRLSISDSRKKNAIRVLIKDINRKSFTDKEEMRLLKRVERKIK